MWVSGAGDCGCGCGCDCVGCAGLPAPPLRVGDEGTVGLHRLAQGRLVPPLGIGTHGIHDLIAQLRGRRGGVGAEARGEGEGQQLHPYPEPRTPTPNRVPALETTEG